MTSEVCLNGISGFVFETNRKTDFRGILIQSLNMLFIAILILLYVGIKFLEIAIHNDGVVFYIFSIVCLLSAVAGIFIWPQPKKPMKESLASSEDFVEDNAPQEPVLNSEIEETPKQEQETFVVNNATEIASVEKSKQALTIDNILEISFDSGIYTAYIKLGSDIKHISYVGWNNEYMERFSKHCVVVNIESKKGKTCQFVSPAEGILTKYGEFNNMGQVSKVSLNKPLFEFNTNREFIDNFVHQREIERQEKG